MSRRSIVWIVALVAMIATGLVFWQVKAAQVKSAELESKILKGLSDDDVQIIVSNQAVMDPSKALSIIDSAESRQAFLKGLREYLALASKARRDGLADDPNVKLVIQNKEKGLLTDLFLTKAEAESRTVDRLTDQQIQAVWTDPRNSE